MTNDISNNVSPSRDEDAAMFRWLRALKAIFGRKPSKHERAIALIDGCLLEGVNTQKRIVAVCRTLGLKPAHVAIVLYEGTGTDPQLCRWQLDRDGTYSRLS